MKRPDRGDEGHGKRFDGSRSSISKKKKNMQRLGGTALSLEAFANAKTAGKNYNPAIKKKQREFYKNAKYVNKYKKSLKQQSLQNDISSAVKPVEVRNKTRGGNSTSKRNNMKKKQSLEELYEKKREEEEKARMEREEMFKAKKEGREKAEARRKASREKMVKKTRHGQPVMKYRIEHLLETIQNSANKNT